MGKDRTQRFPLSDTGDVEILYVRSSAHPTEYAIVLRRETNGVWQSVISADNSHDFRTTVDEHHMHRYAGNTKGKALPLPFPVTDTNDAMSKVITWMTNNWENLIR